MKIIQNWSHLKKRRKQEQFDIQIVKNQIIFYQNLRSYITKYKFTYRIFRCQKKNIVFFFYFLIIYSSEFASLLSSSVSIDLIQTFDLNGLLKKIRYDFEPIICRNIS